jgi:rhomboid protease GluP
MRKAEYQLIETPFPQQQPTFTDYFQRPLPQLWLIHNEGRNYSLIRLQAVDPSGPSSFSRDLRQVADHILMFRKQLHARQLNVSVLYISSGPVSDEVQHRLQNLAAVEDKRSSLEVGVFPIQGAFSAEALDNWGLRLQDQWKKRAELWTEFFDLVHHYSVDQLQGMIENEQKKQEEAFNQVFRYGKPIFTTFFLSVNIIIFLFLEWVGSSTDPQTLIKYGAKWNPLIAEGEYWRLFTPMFLHIGIWHIMFNSMALYFLGGAVERIYGSLRFLGIYMVAGILGTVSSFAFTPNLAAGASGAIFGCFGALLYFGLKQRNLFFRTIGMDVIFILGFNLALGFIMPMVDNFGHLGGLVGGFLAAAMVNLPRDRRYKDRLVSMVAFTVIFLLLLSYGLHRPLDSNLYHYVQSQLDLREGQLDEALHHIKQAIQKGMDSAEAYLQLGIIHNYKMQYEEAEQALKQALTMGAEQAELYFHLSYAQLKQENYKEGIQNLQKAIARNPGMKEAYYNLALIYSEQEEYEYAIEVLERAFERGIRDQSLEELHKEILKKIER